MSAFSSHDQAASVFTELFEILLEDATFSSTVRSQGLSVLFLHSNPDLTVFVDADQVTVDEVPYPPAISIKMSCDVADALWDGRLLMPVALATGRIRVKGRVAKVLEFVPLLQPAFDRYPTIAASAGVTTAA